MMRRPTCAPLAIALAVVLGCGGANESFRHAEELIAKIEAGNSMGKPNYLDYRYEDVLVELAQLGPGDRDYWKAREWIQKIRDGREAALAAAAAEKSLAPGRSSAEATESAGSVVGAAPKPVPDMLEKSSSSADADFALMGFSVDLKEYGAHVSGDVINRSDRKIMLQARITALGADGAELSSAVGSVGMMGTSDRTQFIVTMAGHDPSVAVEYPGGDIPEVIPSLPAFDPTKAVLYRLELLTAEGEPVTWEDGRRPVLVP